MRVYRITAIVEVDDAKPHAVDAPTLEAAVSDALDTPDNAHFGVGRKRVSVETLSAWPR